MWEPDLRSKMMVMHTLLSQPFASARFEAIVRAGALRRLGRRSRRAGK
jgi:hypothetical protein